MKPFLHDTVIVETCHCIIHLSKPIECTTPRMISNVSCPLWVIMMCQYAFTSCDNCAILVVDVDDGEGGACVGVYGIFPSIQQ